MFHIENPNLLSSEHQTVIDSIWALHLVLRCMGQEPLDDAQEQRMRAYLVREQTQDIPVIDVNLAEDIPFVFCTLTSEISRTEAHMITQLASENRWMPDDMFEQHIKYRKKVAVAGKAGLTIISALNEADVATELIVLEAGHIANLNQLPNRSLEYVQERAFEEDEITRDAIRDANAFYLAKLQILGEK